MSDLIEIPPGKAIRFFTSLPVPPGFESLIPSSVLLFWFAYNKDGTVYSGAPGNIVESSKVEAGEEKSRTEVVIDKSAKLSIHGSGSVLGPDRNIAEKGTHLGYSILGLKRPRSLVKHFVGSPNSYVELFDIKSFEKSTDVFLEDVLLSPSAVVVEFVVQPADHVDDLSPYRWRTKPLDDGSAIIIAARKFFSDGDKPNGHLMRVDVVA